MSPLSPSTPLKDRFGTQAPQLKATPEHKGGIFETLLRGTGFAGLHTVVWHDLKVIFEVTPLKIEFNMGSVL